MTKGEPLWPLMMATSGQPLSFWQKVQHVISYTKLAAEVEHDQQLLQLLHVLAKGRYNLNIVDKRNGFFAL